MIRLSKIRSFPAAAITLVAIAASASAQSPKLVGSPAELSAERNERFPEVTERKPFKREQWSFEQRAFPTGQLPEKPLERGLEQIQAANEERAAQKAQADADAATPAAATAGGALSNWVTAGPGPMLNGQTTPKGNVTGRISAIAVDPEDSNRWVVGAAQGGVWVTEDEGFTWSAKTDSMPSLAIGAIRFAPGSPDVVYAGTGESVGSDAYGGAGLLKSTDGGNTWVKVEDPENALVGVSFSEIRVDPANSEIVVAAITGGAYGRANVGSKSGASTRGIKKSTNGGRTWSKVLPTVDSIDASDLEVDASNFNNQFAALSQTFGGPGTGVYRTTDGGANWSPIDGPWNNTTNFPGGVGRIEMAISPSDPNVLYVSIQDKNDAAGAPANARANDGNLLGVWRTTNALAATPTWTLLPAAEPARTKQAWYNHQLLVDPDDSRLLYVGLLEFLVYDGRPGGIGWGSLQSNLHTDMHSIAIVNDRIIVGCDGGIWLRADRGTFDHLVWTNRNNNLMITQFYEGAVHPTDRNLALGGSQDNGTGKFTGFLEWTHELGGDGADAVTGGFTNQYAVSAQHLDIRRTTNGGQSWIDAAVGISDNHDDGDGNKAPFIARFVAHPANRNFVLAGTNNLWRSENFFSAAQPTWFNNSTDGGLISAIAFAPSDTSTFTYAYGTQNGALRLTKTGGGGDSEWIDLNPSFNQPLRWVTQVMFDPTNANTLYATYSGFNTNTPSKPGHVFRTKNALSGAAVWEDISPPVDLPVNAIAIDSDYPHVLWVGTDLGVWEGVTQENGSVTWTHMGPDRGMPNVAVYDLEFQAAGSRRLWAFTHGRSAFFADVFPHNDSKSSARVLTGNSGRVVDTNINAHLEAGEPDHFTGTPEKGNHSVWFEWTAPLDGQATFDTIDSNFDTDLAIYTTGGSWNGLTLPAVVSDNNSGGGGTSRVQFQATAGARYFIAINGSRAEDVGFYALNWGIEDNQKPVVTVTAPGHQSFVNALAAISGTAADSGGIQNGKVQFTLFHAGTGKFWNGSSWVDALTTLDAPVNDSGVWTYTSVPPENSLTSGEYFISASARDNAGNASQSTPGVNQTSFRVDKSPPQNTIVEPAHGATITKQIFHFHGTATDAPGEIARVVLFIRRNADFKYWNGSGWIDDPLQANLSSSFNAETGEWSCTAPRPIPGYPPSPMPNGSYNFIAIAFDKAGNSTQRDAQIIVDYHRIMTWEGMVSGDWDNAANWASKDLGAGLVIPDDTAIVVINNGRTVSTNQNRTVYSVRLLDGRIQFTNGNSRTLTTLKRSTWSGGSFGGIWNVAAGATLELIGEGAKHLSDGSVLNNYGTISWGGPGPIQAEGNGFAENPIINNKEGGVFEVRAGGNLFSRASTRAGTPVFNNEAGARFVKVEPTVVPGIIGTNLLQNADAEAGAAATNFTSIVPPSGWTTDGSFTSVFYSAGGPNDLNTEDSAAVNGGDRYFAGGPGSVHSYASQTVDVSALSTQIDAGELTVTLSGLFGGYLNEADKMEISATFIDETGTPLAGTSTGRVTPADRGGVSQLLPRSTITNLPSGTRTVRITLAAGRQAGEYNDSYADNLKFEIGGGGLGTGPLIVDTFNFNNAGEMECQAGAIAFNSPTSFVNAGALSGIGRFEIQGSTFDLKGPLILEEAIFRIDHGDLRAHADGTASFITVGNAQVQVRGGRLFGKFTNTEGSRMLLTDPESGPYRKFFGDGFVLENFGFVTWTGGGTIQAEGNGFVPNAVFNNKDGGRFDIAADGPLFSRASERAGTPIFNNEAGGLFIKTAGEGTTDLTIFDFKNYGQMTANSGKFALKTNFLHSNAPALKGPGVYELLSGKIDVVGTLTLNNTTFTLTAGDIYAGAGGITLVSTTPQKMRLQGGRLFGTYTVPAGSFLELSDPAAGATPKFFADGVVLNNAGTITWLGGGTIQAEGNGFVANAVFNNKDGGRFEIAADGVLFSRASGRAGTPLFNNEAGALLIKTAGAGASELTVFDLKNYGQMTAQSGGFRFKTGNVLFSNAAPVNGGGFFELHSGRFDIVGSLGVANDTNFTVFGGDVVAGAGGISLVSGTPARLRLQGGRFFGAFTVPSGSFLEMSDPPAGATAKYFGDGVVFNNAGTVSWLAGGTIQGEGSGFAPNPVFNNLAGGRFEIVGDGRVFSRWSDRAGTPVFNNQAGALFVKTAGTGSSLINTFDFNNQGDLLAQTGVFSFNTNFNYNSASLLAGPGRYEVLGGTMFLNGALSIADTTFVFPTGILQANGNNTATLTSTGTGKFILLGGQYRGKLTLSAGSRLEFADPPAGPAVKFFADQAVFDNYGTVVWPGGGKIQAHGDYNNNFIFNNKPGGRFEVGADGELFSRASTREGTPIFNNEAGALFIKTAGESFSELTVFKFNNYGQMNAQSGGFQFKTNVLFSNAAPLVGAGRFYEMRTGRFDIVGALNVGNSTMTLFGTDIVANGPITLEAPAAGRLRLQEGRYFGTFNVPSGSFVEFSDAPGLVKAKYFGDGSVFNNEGTVSWLGGGTIQAEGNGFAPNLVFNNKSGGVFEIAGEGPIFSRASTRDGTPVFNNLAGALVHKTVGGDALVNVFNFDNRGGVQCDDGTLSFNTAAWARDGASYSGDGSVRMAGGALRTDGTVTFSSAFSVLAGEVFGPGTGFTSFTTTETGLLRWGGGRLSGRFALAAGSNMLIDDGGSATATEKDLSDGTTFDNFGTIVWTGAGAIQGGGYGFAPNPIFNNKPGAVFNAAPTGGVFNRESTRDGTPVFNNAGVVNIGIAAGTLTFSGWDFTQAATGKLNIDLGGTNAGEFDRLQVNRFSYGGRATLNGIVSINLINGFTLTPGTSLTPITFDSRTGQFADWHSLGSVVSLAYTNTAVSFTGKAHADENSDWKRKHFGDPTAPQAQPLADANGDGVPNLLEYALGKNPLAAGGAPPIGVAAADGDVPGAALESTDAAANALSHLALTYTRPAGAAALKDVSYSVQRETSLTTNNWSASDVVQQTSVPSEDGLKQTLTMRSTHALGETPAEFLRLTVALTTAGGTSASSDPVAATSVLIPANGSKALGFGIDNLPAFAGTISTRSADGIQTDAAGWSANAFGPYESKPHVARMLSGNSAGRQFRIVSNTADTMTLATGGLDLTVEVAAGDRYQILAVDTLETLLGATAPALTRSSTPGAADNLQVRIPLGWLTYFNDGAQWLRQGGGDTAQNGVVLPPEQGVVFVHRGAAALPFTLTGVVPMTNLKTDLPAGQTTMLGNRFPIATTLSGLSLHSTAGWSANANPALADQVLIREATGWATYYHDGTNWLREGAAPTPQDPSIGIGEAVLVVRRPGVDITVQQARPF